MVVSESESYVHRRRRSTTSATRRPREVLPTPITNEEDINGSMWSVYAVAAGTFGR